MIIKEFRKDPEATLDYTFDWGSPGWKEKPWLAEGETLTGAEVAVADGLGKGSVQHDATRVTVWLSGGTVGQSYQVRCKVTTNAGRTDVRSISVAVQRR